MIDVPDFSFTMLDLRIGGDNVKKKIAVLAGICMLVSVQGTVFAADRNSPDDLSDQMVQSVIRADVPDSHKITVKGEHITVGLGGENQEENIILVERFSEPKLKLSPEKGWKIKKVLLGDTDVTSQIKDGTITLPSVYEDLILTVETEKIKDESGTKTDSKSNTKPNTSSSQKSNQSSKNNQTSTTNGTKTSANLGSTTTAGQGIKAAVTEDEMNVEIYGIGAVAAGGIAVRCLKRKKKKI